VRFVLLSSAPEARKVFSAWEGIRAPRKTNNRTTAGEAVRTCLARGQEQAFAGGKEHFTSPWCWVTFGEQSMVISRERRSPSDVLAAPHEANDLARQGDRERAIVRRVPG
jgi:hypothetical protein